MLMREVAIGAGYVVYVWATPDAISDILSLPAIAFLYHETPAIPHRYCVLIDPRYNLKDVLGKIEAMAGTEIETG